MLEENSSHAWERLLGVACLASLALILAATLWPFRMAPRNGVALDGSGKGVRFKSNGIIRSVRDFGGAGDSQSVACSLEMYFQPESTDSLGTMLQFYREDRHANFVLRQFLDGILIFRNVMDERGRQRQVEVDVDHILSKDKPILVTLTSGPSGLAAYTNGKLVERHAAQRIPCKNLTGELFIGTAASEQDGWEGYFLGLAIYEKELTAAQVRSNATLWLAGDHDGWDADGVAARYFLVPDANGRIVNEAGGGPELEIPATYNVPHKIFLKPMWEEFNAGRDYVEDLIRNILGFVPLGIVLFAYLSIGRNAGSATRIAVIIGAVTSLTIEILQSYIPPRKSGMTDILTNTLGTAIGAMIARTAAFQTVLERVRKMFERNWMKRLE